ncbi:ATP-binding cassette domain-containing protein [Chryseobacterium limigenitum]|uniref:ABC-2 type transport system ATP-binding protein n=1 Tax=Chryseobacterium limigenitum TaxID=1612149 RepID=A0A1K2IS83_9FLAO|nr:ATP-binding cassette domain-containing protein [Chryseobacterium limigenitum]SFZ95316.1 ABC-2 type transport system ATP-binding protein [Chryseobacterium limigenitum]
MLEIRNINVKYSENYILKNLSISVDNMSSNVLGVLGKNGAGKTTLFNTLFGALNFTGEILWEGKKLDRENIAYLETTNYFYPYITGKEYLNYFSADISAAENYNSLFNLPLDEFVDTYSTGMKKKLALIGVLLLDKPVNILDEPFNGMDFEGVHVLYDVIKDMRSKNKIIIISSHIIETLFHTCDNIVFLQDGMIEKMIEKNEFNQLNKFNFTP